MMVGSVEGILGLRPDLNGIRIAPSIPSDWKNLEIEKIFRGKTLHIHVHNPAGRQSGCRSLTLNGIKLEDNYIPAAMLAETNEIDLVM